MPPLKMETSGGIIPKVYDILNTHPHIEKPKGKTNVSIL
jgi:hypothetical protein